MVATRRQAASLRQQRKQLELLTDGSIRLAVLSDTHAALHPLTPKWLAGLKPNAILHAGDVGTMSDLDQLSEYGPLLAVRGNIDAKQPELPDVLVVELTAQTQVKFRILMLHIGVYGPRLHANVARLARAQSASLVVCGHSHVPFIGSERGLTVFNPGSAGPRRFGLPIVFGVLDVSSAGLRLGHVDCETGLPWTPP